MSKNILIDDIINAIVDTINDSNCEEDAKNIIKTIINMYTTIQILDLNLYNNEGEIK